MKQTVTVVALSSVLVSLSCATAKRTVLDVEGVRQTDSWTVVLASEAEQAEKPVDTSFAGQLAAIVNDADFMLSDRANAFLDQVRFALTGDHRVSIKDQEHAHGVITLNPLPLNYYNTVFTTVLVRFYGKDGSVVAQIEVKNGRGYGEKDDAGMAKLTAQKIAEMIH